MKKIELISGSLLSLLFAYGIFASEKRPEEKQFDVNSIMLIEDEAEVDLGFNTADYLPEGFDPYAYPQDVDGFNYIDENDTVELGFDTQKYLPEGFDPYKRLQE